MSVIKVTNASGDWISIPAVKGDVGATPVFTFISETLEPGSQATVTQSGTAENPIVTIGIPRGDTPEDLVLSVNGVAPDQSGNVEIAIPTTTNVTQTLTTTNASYPLLATEAANQSTSVVSSTRFATNVTVNPSSGTIAAKAINVTDTSSSDGVLIDAGNGALIISQSGQTSGDQIVLYIDQSTKKPSVFPYGIHGNASSATKAVQDDNGNIITDTYATKGEIGDAQTDFVAYFDEMLAS